MKKYLIASVILTLILSSCGGTGTGSSQNGEPSKQTEAQTVAASKVPAASGKEFLEYNNSGLQMKLPKNLDRQGLRLVLLILIVRQKKR